MYCIHIKYVYDKYDYIFAINRKYVNDTYEYGIGCNYDC